MPNPALEYPSYYTLSPALLKNEIFLSTLEALHSFNFNFFQNPKSFEDLFNTLQSGAYAIFKERYIVGYFGSKAMYLEPNGWRAMPLKQEAFVLENWLIG